ncbi:phosphatase [Streptomyces ovatisporus]|uniref:Phosphatase n=1 Tax=Streptomyces ovatisporus TaxID=1128682 RepID=A0ABV9A9L1_9ACTN
MGRLATSALIVQGPNASGKQGSCRPPRSGDPVSVVPAGRIPGSGRGNPSRLLGRYASFVPGLSSVSCTVLASEQWRRVDITTRFGVRHLIAGHASGAASIRGAGARSGRGAPGVHTRSHLPDRERLAAAKAGVGPLREVVGGGRQRVCAAGQLGSRTIGPDTEGDPSALGPRAAEGSRWRLSMTLRGPATTVC